MLNEIIIVIILLILFFMVASIHVIRKKDENKLIDSKINTIDDNEEEKIIENNILSYKQFINKIIEPTNDNFNKDFNGLNKYIKDFVFEGKKLCDYNKKFDDTDTKKFQDKFIKFRDTIWEDTSDENYKLQIENQNKFDNLYDNYKNTKIKNIYDDLTGNDSYNNRCLKMPKFDNNFCDTYYVENGFRGKFINDSLMWKYDNENINNGSEFFNGIYAIDNPNDKNMYIQDNYKML